MRPTLRVLTAVLLVVIVAAACIVVSIAITQTVKQDEKRRKLRQEVTALKETVEEQDKAIQWLHHELDELSGDARRAGSGIEGRSSR